VAGSEAIVKALSLLIALAMLGLLVSCSSSSSMPSTPTLNLITVSPTSPSVAAGLAEQFKAMGTYTDGSTKDLTSSATWTSSSTTTATISSAGLAQTKAQGTSTITAASGSISGATTLNVTAAALKSIAVTPAMPTMNPGTFLQFTATGTYTDASTQNLTSTATWSTGDATVVSVVASGASAGLGAAVTNPPPLVGAATVITATLGSVSGNTGVSVSAATLTSIVITDGNLTLAQGTSHGYTALGLYSDGGERQITNQVTWASSTMSVATIAATGRASAATPGTSMISATLGSVSAPPVTLTVTSATIATVVVTPVMHTIAPLTQLPFVAVGIFSDASTQNITQDVTWSSSATGVASVNTTDHLGLVTGVSGGPATITAVFSGVMGSAPLIVSSATVSSIAIVPGSVNIGTNASTELVAKATFSDSTTQIVNQVATWSSSADGVAAVDDTGTVGGVVPGTATITASLGGVNGTADVTVEGVTSVAVLPTTASIPVGAIAHLQLIATLTDSTTQNITDASIWTSGSPAIAPAGDVSNTHGSVFGVAQGTSLIGAFFEPQISSAVVTVTNATLSSLTLTAQPAAPNIPVNGSQAYKLTATYSDMTTQVVTNQAVWTSSDPTVAVVSSGFATPASTGTTTITASFGGQQKSATLTVQ
jgi:trimeric autotransporter adhesin